MMISEAPPLTAFDILAPIRRASLKLYFLCFLNTKIDKKSFFKKIFNSEYTPGSKL